MNKQILRLAIPNIISNLTVPLLSSVDTALVGHLDKVSYLGAIAVGGMIFNFVYWGFGFLRMGTTGLTAQAYGKNDPGESFLILVRALMVGLGFAFLLIVAQSLIIALSFNLVNSSQEVELYSRQYFHIRIFAAPATLSLYAFSGWFLGMQNAKYPLILAVVTNLANIIFNLFFIKIMGMHVDGVAWGTVVANYIGMLTAVYLFMYRYSNQLHNFNKNILLKWSELSKFFAVNRDIFIRTLALIFAFSFFTAKSAESGEMILAVNSILINLWTVMSYGIDGFAFASESLVGRYVGANDRHNLNKAVRYSFYWGVGMACLFSLTYALFPESILSIFTDKIDVIVLAQNFMIYTMIAPVISSFCYIWDGIYIGATASVVMRNAMLICLFFIYLPIYYLLRGSLDNHALWLALTIFMISRGISLAVYYKREIVNKLTTPSIASAT
jgi:multidrug resistance protein, MATE family